MREIKEISIEPRSGTGKGPAYQTRLKGRIPSIVYGGKDAPEPVSVDATVLGRHVETGAFLTTLFVLDREGKKTRVIPRALQRDPVSDRPVHVDFLRLTEGATVRLAIPVRFKSQDASPGLKRGGVLNIVRHTVDLICPAENIPDFLEGDLSGLDINDSLHLNDIKLPEGAKPAIHGHDQTIASIVAPTSVIEEQKAAAAAASAPAAAVEAAPAAAEAAPAAGAAPAAAAGGKAAAGAKAPAKEAEKGKK